LATLAAERVKELRGLDCRGPVFFMARGVMHFLTRAEKAADFGSKAGILLSLQAFGPVVVVCANVRRSACEVKWATFVRNETIVIVTSNVVLLLQDLSRCMSARTWIVAATVYSLLVFLTPLTAFLQAKTADPELVAMICLIKKVLWWIWNFILLHHYDDEVRNFGYKQWIEVWETMVSLPQPSFGLRPGRDLCLQYPHFSGMSPWPTSYTLKLSKVITQTM
jgi:hypothetical protein